jgi:glucan endo-1,3-alpha-glucosidase
MQYLSALLAVLPLLLPAVSAQKYVFAHVVVGNTAAHTQDTWNTDLTLAKDAGIDAFILNIAHGDPNTAPQVANAFAAAEAAGGPFQLAFSFDYLGGGSPWPATGDDSVASYLTQYKGSSEISGIGLLGELSAQRWEMCISCRTGRVWVPEASALI